MKWLLVPALFLFWTASARADYSIGSCQSFFDADAAPIQVRELIASNPGGGVQLCVVPGKPDSETYAVISKVVLGPLGVCYYSVQSGALSLSGTQWVWNYKSPNLGDQSFYMAIPKDRVCYSQGDQRYTLTVGISEGLFLRLSLIWNDLIETRKIDALLADFSSKWEDVTEIEAFWKDVSQSRGEATLSIMRMELENSRRQEAAPHYLLEVYAKRRWGVSLDLTSDSVRLIDIGRIQ